MRASQFFITTLKETPADAEVISHQLMLRAGLVRKLASGLYNWLPLGLRVLRKVEKVVREEMDAAGALELLMPVVQPGELWRESGRWEQYGPELARLRDRHDREFCLGPTHEEVITDIVRNEIASYRQLPINFYQIQTKFRDEIRPRFGIMRGREFTMKDAYSFHVDTESLQATYDAMYRAYSNIFQRLGLQFRAVIADTGAIGGSASHEFHVLASSGEDAIAFSDRSEYAANVELAEALAVPASNADSGPLPLERVDTPDVKTIADVADYLQVNRSQTVKTLLVDASDATDAELVALVLRGDHELNAVKAEKLDAVANPLRMADAETVRRVTGADFGSIGPVGLELPTIVDRSAAVLANFVAGANETGKHLKNINWARDCTAFETADIRNVVAGDPSPDGEGTLDIKRGIEVGHIFQLGTKYSEAMGARVLGENGREITLQMGCYGIGVSRVVAAAIEQNYDDKGIVWPAALAPFTVVLVPMNPKKSDAVRDCTERLYQTLRDAGVEVLLDDRDERPGVKFAEIELIGIPHRVVIGDRGLKNGTLEYRDRRSDNNEDIPISEIESFLMSKIADR